MRDICHMCCNHDARWVVVDDKEHTYWRFYLTRRLKPDLKRRAQYEAYLACEQCRRQIEHYNRNSRRPRRLQFLRWS